MNAGRRFEIDLRRLRTSLHSESRQTIAGTVNQQRSASRLRGAAQAGDRQMLAVAQVTDVEIESHAAETTNAAAGRSTRRASRLYLSRLKARGKAGRTQTVVDLSGGLAVQGFMGLITGLRSLRAKMRVICPSGKK